MDEDRVVLPHDRIVLPAFTVFVECVLLGIGEQFPVSGEDGIEVVAAIVEIDGIGLCGAVVHFGEEPGEGTEFFKEDVLFAVVDAAHDKGVQWGAIAVFDDQEPIEVVVSSKDFGDIMGVVQERPE